jgi:hypothetical protein
MRLRRIVSLLGALSALPSLALASPVLAQPPSAARVLTDLGFSAADQQRVLNGEFVTTDVRAVSNKDLSLSIAFLVTTSPAALSTQILAGDIITADPQVQTYGAFQGSGSPSDLSGLQITAAVAQTFINAAPGEALNLSTSEIGAFDALQGNPDPQQAGQSQLQSMLLARFRAYQASGLAGIAPYARGDGAQTDVGGELRKASAAAGELSKYLPAFQAVLVGYPQATIPGMSQLFHWVSYNISGTPTFALTHTLAASDGPARAIVQRQYYVSTGYNAEQAIAAFLPVQQGTLVAYVNHTFTDQVAGFGGSMKRDIGRKMMASKLKAVFDEARNVVQH